MPGQITAFDIGECMVKAACLTGGKLKKVMAKELPDNMVSGGEIVSMDAMADFIKEMAKENGISRGAAAVILPGGIVIEGLNDSKKLSEKKREKLFDEITENALAWSVSLVDERVIDEINILQATFRAMRQAVDGLTRPADFVYVDGNRSQGLDLPHECVVSGDAKIPSVAAASIIAKVTRDRLMRRFAEQYPQYGFEKHKGYETKAHDEALLAHGPCPIHRMSFLKKFYEKHPEAPR